jgi:short-subunit dehydrogenase
MSRRDIAGMRTIVTGASSGIGRAIVRELARRGGHTVMVARREEPLRALAAEIADDPHSDGRTEVLVGDVTCPEIRQAAVSRAQDAFGGLDALVNNAGIGSFGRFADGDAVRLREIMEVNFFAAAEMIREAVPALNAGRQPIVVNVGSILGHRGIPQMNEYCASKFAMQGLSQSLRVEFKKSGIDLLVVSPGTTQTEFYDHVVHGRGDAPWSTGGGVTPDDVARATAKAMQRGRREIFPNFRGRLLVWANRAAPALVDRFMARYA